MFTSGWIQVAERRVEGVVSLAGPGRTRDEHHAPGLADRPLELRERVRVEAELHHVELQVRLIEKTHDDLLPPHGGENRHAEIHLAVFARAFSLMRPSLRQPPFGDVEHAHDLEAARDRVFQLERRRHLLVEHTVDAVADPHFLLVRLDVDVARAFANGVQEDDVDEAHDRRVFARLLEFEDVHLLLVTREVDLVVADAEIGHHLLVGGPARVVALDGRDDGGFATDHRLDVEPGEELHVVGRVQVRGIRHRHDERGARARHGNDLVLFAHLAADELDDVRLDLELIEIDRREPVLRRQERRDLPVRDETELRERVAQVLAGLLLLLLRGAKLLQADEFFADE